MACEVHLNVLFIEHSMNRFTDLIVGGSEWLLVLQGCCWTTTGYTVEKMRSLFLTMLAKYNIVGSVRIVVNCYWKYVC